MRKTVLPIDWPSDFEKARAKVSYELQKNKTNVLRVTFGSAARISLRRSLDQAGLIDIPVQQIARWMTGCEDIGIVSSNLPEIRVQVNGGIFSKKNFSFDAPDGTELNIRLIDGN